jgi:hypothetical protein
MMAESEHQSAAPNGAPTAPQPHANGEEQHAILPPGAEFQPVYANFVREGTTLPAPWPGGGSGGGGAAGTGGAIVAASPPTAAAQTREGMFWWDSAGWHLYIRFMGAWLYVA